MSSNSSPKKRAARRAPTQTIGTALGISNSDALFERLSDTTSIIDAVKATQKTLEHGEHTLEEALELPATITNKRKIEKLLELPQKYASMIEDAGLAVQKDLFPKITIAKAEAHAKELKDAERKRRQQARNASSSATTPSASGGNDDKPFAKKRKVENVDNNAIEKSTAPQESASKVPKNVKKAEVVTKSSSASPNTKTQTKTAVVAKLSTSPSHNSTQKKAATVAKPSGSPNGTHKKTASTSKSPKGTRKKAAASVAEPTAGQPSK